MRSTTVGWLTSILRVLPVAADHTWLNRARPELRDSISHPIAPKHSTPANNPMSRANTTPAENREALGERGLTSESCSILQGYHHASGITLPARDGRSCLPPAISSVASTEYNGQTASTEKTPPAREPPTAAFHIPQCLWPSISICPAAAASRTDSPDSAALPTRCRSAQPRPNAPDAGSRLAALTALQ